ncbi:hypothetical protein [Rahnella woolbedingensis]|uniref:Uncharacterized protein n=1 Tax=Rahnella woolbedingensis TaxID=1510574 RepID=A0A419NEJ2_9GAMM|nr:hypothetical protein [Rahnella woolbedingensis]RJT47191.1 hypothetical protein D6C13_02180 [Rahnella woolbedingensis]
MKYEITKGSEKDFEGVPEWCTIVYNYGNSDAIRFCNGWKEGCKFSGTKEFLTRQYDVSGCDLDRYTIIAERRPITEPAWDGFSSVRVGEACEVRPYSDATEWQAGIVNYLSDHTVVIGLSSMTNGKAELVAHPATLKFRPIRSPEDVARDEVIANICFEIGVRPNNTVVQQTYDAIAAGKIPGVKLE